MGGTQSSEGSRHGYHVLKVKENSPAYHAGIAPFFDYIIGINGIKLDNDPTTLQEQFLNNVDREVVLELYSSKEQELREVSIVPSRNWMSEKNAGDGLIGASIRYCSYDNAGEHVWHVLEVQPNSPAEMAGVVPHTDYVIGSPQLTMRSEDDFYNLVEEAVGRPLRLYIYNSDWDSTREVVIVPNHDWGGSGSLGCDVGYGLLHRIPRRRPTGGNPAARPVSTYSDTIFSSADYRYDGAFDDHLYHPHDHDHDHDHGHNHDHDHDHDHSHSHDHDHDHGHDDHDHSHHHPHDHPHDHYHPHDHGDGHAHVHDGHEHEQDYPTYDDVHLHAQPPTFSPLPAPVPTPVIPLGTLEQSVEAESDTAAAEEEEIAVDPSSVGIEPAAPEPEVQAMVEHREVGSEVEAGGEAGLAEEEEEDVSVTPVAAEEEEEEEEAEAATPDAQVVQGGPGVKSKKSKRKGKK